MKLRVYNLVSREEIPIPVGLSDGWDSVSAGGNRFIAARKGGGAVLFTIGDSMEEIIASPMPEDFKNLLGTAVSPFHAGAYAAWDLFGNLRLVTPEESSVRKFPVGIREAVLGSLLGVLTCEGRVYTRRYCACYGDAWKDAGLENIVSLSSGPYRLCALGRDGAVHILETERDLGNDIAPQRLGKVEAVADGSGGLWTVRNGKLCRNGRVFSTGGEVSGISVGISHRLELLFCRRPDGTFLSAMAGTTYSPSSFPMDDAQAVRTWAAGDCFAVCLS